MPANTGNIGRTCVAAGARLHLIEPLGFKLNEKMLKRAGLDYWDKLDVTVYDDYADFQKKNPGAKIYMATTKAQKTYCDVSYEDDCYIMFGRESAGIPEEILVDNEIAVQNLTKMAQQKGYQYSAEKLAEREYRVLFTVGEASETPTEEAPACAPDTRTDTVVAISSDKMGIGADDLGKSLLKAFVFALTQQDKLPKTILFYNSEVVITRKHFL